ncbi:unnamed protein product [Phytophthora fragariaefolia]|uniref:Unnamed protein product n=1 Tax=Phytophthora fragariaefolia TaxID=1490495 RepID=A0A9W6WZH8_9STRA|nr:unnamed protein product [Phytophthora fragariaefolia]
MSRGKKLSAAQRDMIVNANNYFLKQHKEDPETAWLPRKGGKTPLLGPNILPSHLSIHALLDQSQHSPVVSSVYTCVDRSPVLARATVSLGLCATSMIPTFSLLVSQHPAYLEAPCSVTSLLQPARVQFKELRTLSLRFHLQPSRPSENPACRRLILWSRPVPSSPRAPHAVATTDKPAHDQLSEVSSCNSSPQTNHPTSSPSKSSPVLSFVSNIKNQSTPSAPRAVVCPQIRVFFIFATASVV